MQARPEPKVYMTAWVDAQTARLIDDFARREDRTRASALRCVIRAGVAQMIRGGVAPTGAESAQDAPESDGGMDAPGDGPDAPQRAAGAEETGIPAQGGAE